MTIESFIYAGIVATTSQADRVRYVLGSLGVLLAAVGSVSMRRFELRANADRLLVGLYERELSKDSTFRVIDHRSRWPDRVRELREIVGEGSLANDELPPGVYYGSGHRRLGRPTVAVDQFFAVFPASLQWTLLMVLTGLGAMVVAILLSRS
jgi:hypothetical protein